MLRELVAGWSETRPYVCDGMRLANFGLGRYRTT